MSRRNKKGREISGIVLLDKDTGLSSNAALQQVKRLFFAKKAGHTGSLDPLASGILPICLGQSTKVAGYLLNANKRYFVRAQLGVTTTTGDSEGEVVNKADYQHISFEEVAKVVNGFIGSIEQVPPMYSALKKDGQPLYKLARKGIEVERESRKVEIFDINSVEYAKGVLSMSVYCSKGTYIRTLIEDIGQRLGCGAHVVTLRRIGFADVDVNDALTFSKLQALKEKSFETLDEVLLSSEVLLTDMDEVFLNESQTSEIKFGRLVQILPKKRTTQVKLFDHEKKFIGIGKASKEGEIAPKRLFV